jgi:hypothetical protein
MCLQVDDENKLRAIFDMGTNEVRTVTCGCARWQAMLHVTVCLHLWFGSARLLPLACVPPQPSCPPLQVHLHHLNATPAPHAPPQSHEQGRLTWTNTGSLGGGGDLKLTARMKLDKDSMQQVRAFTASAIILN